MLNAMIWALACFGVVAADIALSVVLFSALGVASVFMGFSIDDLDIQLLQAAAQTASFLMALLWWRYLWPRSFMARWQGERPLGGGARGAWKRIACVIVIGLALQVVVGYVTEPCCRCCLMPRPTTANLSRRRAWATRAIWPS